MHLTLGQGLSIQQSLQVIEGWPQAEMVYSQHYATQAVAAPQFIDPNPAVILNPQLRRALAHAIDRHEIVETIQSNIGEPSSALVSPTGPDYEAVKHAITNYAYDPRRSAQLIEGLGYSLSGGVFRGPAGQELTIEAMSGSSEVYTRTTLAVADYWKRIGAPSEPRVTPSGADASVVATRPGFLMAPLRTELDTRFLSSSVPRAENNYRGSNDARYANPDLDALINKYFVTLPRGERQAVLADVMRHLTENVVVIHLFYNVTPQIKHRDLVNVVPRTVRARALDAHLWEMR